MADLKNMMKRTHKVPAVALDNAALEIVDDKYRILFLENGATAQKCFWKNGKYVVKNIETREFRDIKELITK